MDLILFRSGGWVGGWVGGEMEIKANLSLSLDEVEAELGNKTKCFNVSKTTNVPQNNQVVT